jgi:DNA-binding NarL/FixJ family response regulator
MASEMDCRMKRESALHSDKEIGRQFEQHGPIRCVVVLEDRDAVRERIEELLKDANWVAIPEQEWKQCGVWAERLVRYFILDIVLFEDRAAGFKALEAIRKVAPDAYCAIVTEDMARVRNVAHNLGADHICGKSEEDLKDLLDRLDAGSPLLSEREQALLALTEIRDRSAAIETLLDEQAISQAEHELVTLEPPLSRAFSLTSLGDEFGAVIDALRFGLVNQPGRQLDRKQWGVWLDVLEKAFTTIPLDGTTALNLAGELDAAGWITEPPSFGLLAEFLLGDDAEHG